MSKFKKESEKEGSKMERKEDKWKTNAFAKKYKEKLAKKIK